MGKYRKRPIVIEAFQLTAAVVIDPTVILPGWLVEASLKAPEDTGAVYANGDGTYSIVTLEGTMLARVGDYIIQGVHGELYPCKLDIFVATYEEIQP